MEHRETPPTSHDLRALRALGLEATQASETVPGSEADLPPPRGGDESMPRHPLHVISAPSPRQEAPDAHDLLDEDVPNISVSTVARVWREKTWAGLRLDVSSIEPRFMEQYAEQLRRGVHGRGMVEYEAGKLTVRFALRKDEIEAGTLRVEYRDALLSYLNLPASTVIDERILVRPDLLETDAESNRRLQTARILFRL